MKRLSMNLVLCFLALFTISHALLAGVCSEGEEKSKILELKALPMALKEAGLVINSIESLRRPEFRSYLRVITRIDNGCMTRALYDQMVKTLKEINYPTEYLHYMVTNAQKSLGLKQYQIGDQWNRQLYLGQEDLPYDVARLHPSIAISGYATIETDQRLQLRGVGTVFYLGKINGEHIVGTAAHVFQNDRSQSHQLNCIDNTYHFPAGPKMSLKGKRLVGAWPQIDFALCALDIPHDKEMALEGLIKPLRVNWDREIKAGSLLTTIGYGYFENPKLGKPRFENSSDCRVFFGDKEAQWRDGKRSIAVGCDASSGDSGSPIVDRLTGEWAGVIWGVREDKSGATSAQLRERAQGDDLESAWLDLTMAISPATIRNYLASHLDELESKNRAVVEEFLRQ